MKRHFWVSPLKKKSLIFSQRVIVGNDSPLFSIIFPMRAALRVFEKSISDTYCHNAPLLVYQFDEKDCRHFHAFLIIR
ncbi:hypothetical protein SODG_005261 [Sodalis praecaptivus]